MDVVMEKKRICYGCCEKVRVCYGCLLQGNCLSDIGMSFIDYDS